MEMAFVLYYYCWINVDEWVYDTPLSCSSCSEHEEREDIVTENDLEHLLHLLEGKDGPIEWQCFLEKSTSNMGYQAWRYEPQVDSFHQLKLLVKIIGI